MVESEQCRATKRDDTRCTYPAKYGGFCGVRFPRDSESPVHAPDTGSSTFKDRVTLAAQLVALTGGTIKTIETIIELWQRLAFGPGPSMPRDYEYLVAEFGPSYPSMPDIMIVGNWGADSIPWSHVREMYDYARTAANTRDDDVALTEAIERLDSMLRQTYDRMQPQLRSRLYELIGAIESDQDVAEDEA